MNHWIMIAAFLVIASSAHAEPTKHESSEFPECNPCSITEFSMLVVLLNDPILRRVVCRLSTQAFEPGVLAKAIGVKDRSEIVRRINTLRRWGLVRIDLTKWGTHIAGAVPGKGEKTLRRWTERYCGDTDTCMPTP